MPKDTYSDDLDIIPKPKLSKKRKVMILEDSDQSNEHFPPLRCDDNDDDSKTKLNAATKSKKSSKTQEIVTDTPKPAKTMKNYFMAMSREPPKKLGSRPIPRGKDDCLEGLTFVITGILDSIERDDATNLIKRHGGKVTTSVSGKTSYVVLGREAGPAKLDKIKKLKVKTIDDEELYRMIEAHPVDAIKEDHQLKMSNNAQMVLDISTTKGRSIQVDTNSQLKSIVNRESISKDNTDTTLWVDKYKPTSVKTLVGQHGPNSPANKLLAWLKNWITQQPHTNTTSKKSGGGNFGKDEGSQFKAALLSGKPGVGKTTTAILCCKELNIDYIELNASDTRNRNLMKNTIKESTKGGSFSFFRPNQNTTHTTTHVIIMDEVDGISGNQDRGGLTELVATIKHTNIPIICICNDRASAKIRTLANYCYDLRFQRPRVEQIKAFCSSITFKEKLTIQPQALSEIIAGADQDIRQVVNRLQMWSATKVSLNFDQVLEENKHSYKDSSQSVFEAIRKLLSSSGSSVAAPHRMSINEKMDQFFSDYSIMPLFMQENYLLVQPTSDSGNDGVKLQTLKMYTNICDLMALSTITDKLIRSKQAWSLLPVQGLLSCVLPSDVVNGHIHGMINFPQWLGKNSTQGKNERFLDQISIHTRVSAYSNRRDLILDSLPFMHRHMVDSLIDPNCIEDGSLEGAVELMKHYNLTREDWDLICELQLYDNNNHKNSSNSKARKIPSKTLSAFTRSLNKVKRVLPYSQSKSSNKKSVKVVAEELLKLNLEQDHGDDDDNDDVDDSSDELPVPDPVLKPARKRATPVAATAGKGLKKSKVI